jgi:hypothetical protein
VELQQAVVVMVDLLHKLEQVVLPIQAVVEAVAVLRVELDITVAQEVLVSL